MYNMDRRTLLLNDVINDKSNRTKAKKTGTNVSKTEKSRICSNTEMTDKWNLLVVIKWLYTSNIETWDESGHKYTRAYKNIEWITTLLWNTFQLWHTPTANISY